MYRMNTALAVKKGEHEENKLWQVNDTTSCSGQESCMEDTTTWLSRDRSRMILGGSHRGRVAIGSLSHSGFPTSKIPLI